MSSAGHKRELSAVRIHADAFRPLGIERQLPRAEPVVDTSHNSVIVGPANIFALDTDLGGAVALPTMRPRPSGIHEMLLEVLSVKTCGYVTRSNSRRSPPSTGIRTSACESVEVFARHVAIVRPSGDRLICPQRLSAGDDCGTMTRRQYEDAFGTNYRKPRILATFVVAIFKVLPKFGPFKTLAFEPLTPAAEKMAACCRSWRT